MADTPKGYFVLFFSPEHWGAVGKFERFWPTTHQFNKQTHARLRGVSRHLDKFKILMGMAKSIEPQLDEDDRELQINQHTSALRSKQLAAVIDTLFCSLYSSLDCTRYVIGKAYGNLRGYRDSTTSVFEKGHKGKLDRNLPQELRDAFQETAEWFESLRAIRTAITHADVGYCSRDGDNGNQLIYWNEAFSRRDLKLHDPLGVASRHHENVSKFVERAFGVLNETLNGSSRTKQLCGIYSGRLYERSVSASEAINVHGGVCLSHRWFEQEGNPKCPFRDYCGAFVAAQTSEQSQDAKGLTGDAHNIEAPQ